jgi:hypothetical protein
VLDEHLKRLTREGWLAQDQDAGDGTGVSERGGEPIPQLPLEAGARVFGTLGDELTQAILLRLGRSRCEAGQMQADLDESGLLISGDTKLFRVVLFALHEAGPQRRRGGGGVLPACAAPGPAFLGADPGGHAAPCDVSRVLICRRRT